MEELEVSHYLRVLRRRIGYVLATLIFALLAAALYTRGQTPAYRATAEVLLQGRPSEQIVSLGDQTGGRTSAAGAVATEIAVMRSAAVREAAAKELGRPASVSITRDGDTEVVAVTATSADPDEAARIAQIYSETYVSVRREQLVDDLLAAVEIVQAEITALDELIASTDQPLRDLDAQILSSFDPVRRGALQAQRDQIAKDREGPIARRLSFQQQLDDLRLASNLTKTGGAQILSPASVPSSPYAPQKRRWLMMAGALGLVLGVVIAFVREHFDDRLRTKDGFDRRFRGLPVLALIPATRRRGRKGAPLVTRSQPWSSSAEAYSRLRTALQLPGVDGAEVVLVASPGTGDGKSTVAANLAVSLGRAGRRVVLVDANLRRPVLHALFGLENTSGLSSVLLEGRDVRSVLQAVPDEPGLTVLPAGRTLMNPADVLSHPAAGQVISALMDLADVVVVDGPPLLAVTDGVALAGTVGAQVLMVVRAGRTRNSDLADSLELVRPVAPVVGVVLNRVTARRSISMGRGHDGHSPGERL